MAKFYAIKKGRIPGIYTNWSEVKKQVEGFSGSDFKAFSTEKEAKSFLEESLPTLEREEQLDVEFDVPNDFIEIYVDGSYSSNPPIYGSGWVAVEGDESIKKKSFSGEDERYLKSNQVPGEVFGCIDAINWAKESGYKGVIIYYDYEGIEKWATGQWKANSDVAKDYIILYKQASCGIDVVFRKVKAHSGVNFNEVADKLAKSSLLKRGVRTNRDGGLTLFGIDREELEMVFELIGAENESFHLDTNTTMNGCVNFTLSSEGDHEGRIVINCYDTGKTVVQGKESSFMQYTLTLLLQLCESGEDVVETLNVLNEETINTKQVEEKFNEVLPNYRFTSNKLDKTLKQATFYLSLDGFRYDYSDLPMPILRAIDHYLHVILQSAGLKTVTSKGVNNFAYFQKDSQGVYILDTLHEKKFTNSDQVDYLNLLYNFYRVHRHTLFHWDSDSEDTRVIETIEEARGLISDGFEILDKYYILFK